MVHNYNQYHSKMTNFWIAPLVNSKDGVDFAMLFPLRLLHRWGKAKTRNNGERIILVNEKENDMEKEKVLEGTETEILQVGVVVKDLDKTVDFLTALGLGPFEVNTATHPAARVKGKTRSYEVRLARNPTGRMATPQEIANAVVFISSPCSTFTSGINMIVDGAMTDRVNY